MPGMSTARPFARIPGSEFGFGRFAPFWTAILLPLAISSAQGQAIPSSSEPVFSARLVDGRSLSGRLAGIGLDGTLRLVSSGETAEEIPPTRLFKLTREAPPSNLASDGGYLLFPDGDRLPRVSIGSAGDNALDVTSNLIGKLKVPLDSLLAAIFSPPAERDAFDFLCDRVRSEPRKSEVVWMANGDRRAGGFLGLDDRAVKLQVEAGQVDIERLGVVALGFDPGLINYPLPTTPFLEVSLADGTRLGMTGCQLDRGQMTGMTRFGQRIQFPLSEVVGLLARSDSIVFLSDREVAATQYVAYVGPPRPFRTDLAVDGRRLQLSGQSYDRGLGTQSRTLLAYKLKPGDRRFQATVGLDDRAGPFGSVAFRVLVDGRERFATPAMSAKEPAMTIDIDLVGSKTLILITEFGDRGDVRDLADWAEARIIR